MRLLTFSPFGNGTIASRPGLLVGDEVIDLTDAAIGLPADITQILSLGGPAWEAIERAPGTDAPRYGLSEVALKAPVPRPPKVLAIARNYLTHIEELQLARPEYQTWFNKQRTCVIGPEEAIRVPKVSNQVDYEGELAMVVAKRCRDVSLKDAPSVIAGCTIVNDVSVRDWQWRTPTMTIGKSFDTHGPMGPYVVAFDELGDPHDLRLKTWVNDELRQDASTSDLLFSCWEMVSHLSSVFTLEPGDIISTGTPAGVGASFDPPRWLQAGDRVTIEIEGLGVLTNPVVGPDHEDRE